MGRRNRSDGEERTVRLSKRVMGKLRYEYNLEEIEREKFIEDQLKELAEWQKQAGQRVRIQERERI